MNPHIKKLGPNQNFSLSLMEYQINYMLNNAHITHIPIHVKYITLSSSDKFTGMMKINDNIGDVVGG